MNELFASTRATGTTAGNEKVTSAIDTTGCKHPTYVALVACYHASAPGYFAYSVQAKGSAPGGDQDFGFVGYVIDSVGGTMETEIWMLDNPELASDAYLRAELDDANYDCQFTFLCLEKCQTLSFEAQWADEAVGTSASQNVTGASVDHMLIDVVGVRRGTATISVAQGTQIFNDNVSSNLAGGVHWLRSSTSSQAMGWTISQSKTWVQTIVEIQGYAEGVASSAGVANCSAAAKNALAGSSSALGVATTQAAATVVRSGAAVVSGTGAGECSARKIASGVGLAHAVAAVSLAAVCVLGAVTSTSGAGESRAGSVIVASGSAATFGSAPTSAAGGVVRNSAAQSAGCSDGAAAGRAAVSGAATAVGGSEPRAAAQLVAGGSASSEGAARSSCASSVALDGRALAAGAATETAAGQNVLSGAASAQGVAQGAAGASLEASGAAAAHGSGETSASLRGDLSASATSEGGARAGASGQAVRDGAAESRGDSSSSAGGQRAATAAARADGRGVESSDGARTAAASVSSAGSASSAAASMATLSGAASAQGVARTSSRDRAPLRTARARVVVYFGEYIVSMGPAPAGVRLATSTTIDLAGPATFTAVSSCGAWLEGEMVMRGSRAVRLTAGGSVLGEAPGARSVRVGAGQPAILAAGAVPVSMTVGQSAEADIT